MFDPPILDGAKTFLYIAIGLISFGASIAILDVIKNVVPKKDDAHDHKD